VDKFSSQWDVILLSFSFPKDVILPALVPQRDVILLSFSSPTDVILPALVPQGDVILLSFSPQKMSFCKMLFLKVKCSFWNRYLVQEEP